MLDKKIKITLKIVFPVVAILLLWKFVIDLDYCCYINGMPQYSSVIQQEPGEGLKDNTPIQQQEDGSANPNSSSVKSGYHIHINLDALTMYVYKDGQLVKTYPVSGGKPGTPSPYGTWKIIHKDTWGKGFGGAWMGLNVPWGKYGIHGTLEPWVVGKTHASKGCIRMKNKDAQELYKIIPYGATVTITQKYKPFRILKSGDTGSDVAEIQKALKKLCYYGGGIDGKFGAGMKKGVIEFQKDNKLQVTGTVTRQTYNLIMQRYKDAEERDRELISYEGELK